jgi:hypothetical protein
MIRFDHRGKLMSIIIFKDLGIDEALIYFVIPAKGRRPAEIRHPGPRAGIHSAV